jgi:hypothetical protein
VKQTILYLLVGFFFLGTSAQAQTITTTQALDFGEAVILANDAQYEIVVSHNGSYSVDPQISLVTPPTEGIYQLSGAPALQLITAINITVTQQMIGAGEDFIIDNFDINNNPQTDASGDLTVEVGARLRTSGTGNPYLDATTYNSVMTMDIIY